jgi:hypothetical protein
MSNGIPLNGKTVSNDAAMEKVIAAQARVNALQREVSALRKDRDELLSEYTDMRTARPVHASPLKGRKAQRTERVRVYVGDLHGMRMDRGAVAAFLSDVKTLDPDEVVLGGDMLECGGHLAKHQPIGYVALCDYTYQEDVLATNWFLDALQKAAPSARIVYLEGNHEHRIERWCVDQALANQRDAEFLRTVYGPVTLLRLREREIAYYHQSEIHGEGLTRGWLNLGNMMVVHNPFGDQGGGKSAAVKAVGKTAANVTFFHTHTWDQSPQVFPVIGLVAGFCPGCLCEIQPMWKHSDPSGWNQGYDIDFIAKSGNFQRIHVPIWRGESLAGAMIERFKS